MRLVARPSFSAIQIPNHLLTLIEDHDSNPDLPFSHSEAEIIERRAEAYQAAAKYCAYQDRCTREVLRKLEKFTLTEEDVSEVLKRLREEQWLDDERFARSFARGKFRIKVWGRIKIKQELLARGIDRSLAEDALTELNEEEYRSALNAKIRRHATTVRASDAYDLKVRLTRWANGRGYENWITRGTIEDIAKGRFEPLS